MVKKYKKVKDETYCDYFCDVCGKQIFKNTIGYEDEKSYNYGSEGGYKKEYVYDICNECMKTVIMPIIKEKIGKEYRIDECEW